MRILTNIESESSPRSSRRQEALESKSHEGQFEPSGVGYGCSRATKVKTLCIIGGFLLLVVPAHGEVTRQQVDQWLNSNVQTWRWQLGEAAGAERADFDDSRWGEVELGFKWWPHDSSGWFRTRITVPETVNGIPVRGGTLRMRAGVDNGARAYVNAVFKQEFEWAKGDFVLTENAEPGTLITVALQATNRPGSGSLYEAWLVNARAEALVDGLRGLTRTIDFALEDQDYVPAAEAAHWRQLGQDALQALDIAAYQACDRDKFLGSVEKAFEVVLADKSTVEARLSNTTSRLERLKQQIQTRRDAGLPAAYETADARVVESFLRYARDDLAESSRLRQIRGLKGAAYIERLCEEAIQRAAGWKTGVTGAAGWKTGATGAAGGKTGVTGTAGGKTGATRAQQEMPVPRYRTAPVSIRDGAFWQNERPVYFTGVGHFGQVREDIPILNDYGLNIIQFEMGPANALPNADRVDTEAIRRNVVQWLDKAAAHNVAVNLLISPHYFPAWAYEADPAHRQCGHGFLKYCIEAPNTCEVMEKWLDALMPLIARHPALHSICLSNEPQYQGRCGYERAAFNQWLKVRWGSIGNLNTAYGTKFMKFEEIELPQDASSYGLYFDRWRFNQDRFVAFHEMLRDRIHKYAPDLPVHAKVMSHAFEDPGRFEVGIDYERFTQLDRIAGNDCTMDFTGSRRGEYACDWQTMAMNYTLQHSAAPGSPIFNSENHLIADGDARYIPESYIRTVFWQEAIHGQGATTTWVWERAQGGDFAENILTRANCVHAMGRTGLDLQRLAPEVHALSQARGELAILYAYSSLLPSKDYVDEARAAFEGAYFTGAVSDFITERQIEFGRLAEYKVVVVPRASHTPDAVVERLNQYIRDGGTVLTVGPCFTKDEYGHSRREGLVSSSRGRWISYPEPLSPRAYRDILDRVLNQGGVTRRVRIEGAHGEPIWGVNVRSVESNGRVLVNLLNLSRQPQQLRLLAKPALREAVNLIDGKAMDPVFTLQPLEPLLLALKRS